MSTDATETPTPGAEPDEDKSQSIQAPDEGAAQETQAPDYLGENFDVSTLHEDARAAVEYAREQDRLRRADYTRKTQEVAEQRKQAESITAALNDLRDPETRDEAAKWLAEAGLLTEELAAEVFGWETEDDDDENPDDPVSQMRREWEEFKAERASEREKAKQERLIASVDEHIGNEFTALEAEGHKLTDRAKRLIVSEALVTYPQSGPDGMPDIRAAFKDYADDRTEFQKEWANGKTAAQPTSPGGGTATEVPDWANMSPAQRSEYLSRRVNEVSGRAGP